MASTPQEQVDAMIANLPAKTGRSLAEWLAFLGGRQGEKHGALVKALKEEGVGHGYANLIAQTFRGSGQAPSATPDADQSSELVEAQLKGKEALRPIFDALIAAASGLGADVEVSPKKTYVSLRRSKQFAIVQPSTKTRLDLGLKLADIPPKGRLESSGSFNAMVSHRVRLESLADFDAEVAGWLKRAYEEA